MKMSNEMVCVERFWGCLGDFVGQKNWGTRSRERKRKEKDSGLNKNGKRKKKKKRRKKEIELVATLAKYNCASKF